MPTLDLDGFECSYEDRGSGSSILLIHGMGGSTDVWGEAFDLLAQNHRVIAYDRRGFARSGGPPVADIRRHADDAAAFLRKLDAAPATVVGWSSGGVIALDLAVRSPELISALVLEEPPLHAKRRPGLRQLRAVVSAQLLSRVKDDRAASERFFRWAFRYTSGGTGFDRLPESLRESMLASGPANMADLRAGTGEHLKKEDLEAIGCPVVCALGELSDPAFHRATNHIANLVAHAQVKQIDGAGHGMHLERPEEFVAAVREAAS